MPNERGPLPVGFQVELKRDVAEFYGLNWSEVDLPYPEWAELRDRYTFERFGDDATRFGPAHESDGVSAGAPCA